jgi:hypothetical protein
VFLWAYVHGHRARVGVVGAEMRWMLVFVCKVTDRRNLVIAHSSRGFGAFTCLASVSLGRRLFLPDASMLAEATDGTSPEQA